MTRDLSFYTLCGFNFPFYSKSYITFIYFFVFIKKKRHLLKFQTLRAFHCSLPIYQTKQKLIN